MHHLYYFPGSCALAPHIALAESGLEYDLRKVNKKTHQLEDGSDYYAINPLGYVPFLVRDDGQTLHEVPAILMYVASQTEPAKLARAQKTIEYFRLLEWLALINSEVHKVYSPLLDPAMPAAAKEIFTSKLKQRYQWLDGALSGQPYLLADGFSVADAYLFTVTNWAKVLKLDLAGFANVQAFQARVFERPAVQRAMKEQGLIK